MEVLTNLIKKKVILKYLDGVILVKIDVFFLIYPIDQVESIKIELKQGLSPKRMIYLKIRGKSEIPLTKVGQPMTIEEIESQAAELAKFLKVSILMNS